MGSTIRIGSTGETALTVGVESIAPIAGERECFELLSLP
jgi:hypothetical protein